MSDIGPGDVVECVEGGGNLFTRGAIYHVRAITSERTCECIIRGVRPWAFNHIGLQFSDAPDPKRGAGWCVYMFRPISRRSSFESILEQLKQAAPTKPEREGVEA